MKPFAYLNITRLGDTLTEFTPVNFPATIADNPCGNFNGSTYVYVDYPNKCYGTWLNGVGYGAGSETDASLTSPRSIES